MASTTKPKRSPPLDLSHHFSAVTRARLPSEIKQYYRFFQIPGIGNLAGGLPNAKFFPFDTLEGQAARAERWKPSPEPTEPSPPTAAGKDKDKDKNGDGGDKGRDVMAPTHVVVPKLSPATDPLRKIDLTTALQYGLAQGYPPLLSFVRQFARHNLFPNVPYAGGPEVVMTCGSTDGFAKTLQLLVDPWVEGRDPIEKRDGLLCEAFVYGNAVNQAKPLGVQVVPVELDGEGMLATGPGGLEDVLANWDESKGRRPRLMYSVTMGHNPTSGVLSLARRREIYALCSKYDVIIVEDDPYWYLQYPSADILEAQSRGLERKSNDDRSSLPEGWKSSGYPFLDSLVPSYLNIDVDGRVIRLDTFSKTVAPGCRLGWITAQPDFVERFVRISETSTQQPSGFVQSMISEVVLGPQAESTTRSFLSLRSDPYKQSLFSGWKTDGWVRWLEGLRGEYERRMNRMCTILDEGMFRVVEVRGCGGIGPVRSSFHDSPMPKWKNGSDGTAFSSHKSDDAETEVERWTVVTKTQLYEYDWPRGGMFIWIRMLFETHPLFERPFPAPVGDKKLDQSHAPLKVTGAMLCIGLTMFLTHAPYLTLVAPGIMFSATDKIRDERAWQYYRLCFAAESDENVERCSKGFAQGVQDFWAIEDLDELKALLDEAGGLAPPFAGGSDDDRDDVEGLRNCVEALGAGWMGC